MADQLYIPRKDVDFFTINRLQRQLEDAGITTDSAHGIAQAIADHTIANNRDRWLEIERWANRNVTPTTNSNFDCIVNASLTTNSPGTFTFTNVADAVSQMFALGFTFSLRVGFVPNWNTSTQLGTPAKDLTTLSNLNTPRFISVTNINAGQIGGTNSSPPAEQGDGCIWDINGHAHILGTQVTSLTLTGITLINSGTVQTSFFGNTYNGRISAHYSLINGSSGASPTAGMILTTGTLWATECKFQDASVTGTIWIENCYILAASTTTSQTWGTAGSGWVVATDCLWTPPSGGPNPWPFIFPAPTVLILGASVSRNSWPISDTGLQRTQFRFNGTNQLIYVESASGTLGSQPNQWLDIQTTSSPDTLRLDGTFGELTIIAPLANAARQGHVICGTCLTTSDITGPCALNLTVGHANTLGGNSLTLRGSGCTGIVRVEGSNGGGAVGLNMIGCTDCNIQASGNLFPGATVGTQKGWAIDATSARNILDFAGATQFPVAGTDAGAGDVVRFT